MPAHCSRCGNTVMTYWQYGKLSYRRTTWEDAVKFWSPSPHAKCAHCGAEVTQRHYRTVGYGFAAFFLAVLVAMLFLTDSSQLFVAVCVVLGVLVAAEGYWAWRTMPWDPVQPSAAAPPAPPPAG